MTENTQSSQMIEMMWQFWAWNFLYIKKIILAVKSWGKWQTGLQPGCVQTCRINIAQMGVDMAEVQTVIITVDVTVTMGVDTSNYGNWHKSFRIALIKLFKINTHN